jgi:hypothetical protein
MSEKQLNGNLVYSPGADLWVIPDKSSSAWSQNLDWYLNFQISKAHSFKRSEISDTLQDIIKEEEVEEVEIPPQEGKPLLIASPKHLPNVMTVVLSYDNRDPKAWLANIQKTWLELGKPSLRVFLPKDFTTEKFLEFSRNELDDNITFVTE